MYLPAHFNETRSEELHGLISRHPLGALVVNGPEGLDANHLPFEFIAEAGGQGSLIAHVARANSFWKDVSDGADALVIFRGEHAYVSPSWYPSKHETHRHVPTWNYRVVHVNGKVRIRDDERFVRGVVARLTRTHEGRTGAAQPWKMTDSASEYIDRMLGAIVGIEIEITRMVGKWKVSQNRDERDRVGAAEELRKRGETALAEAMLAVKGDG